MVFVTSVGSLKSIKCVRSADKEHGIHPWFRLECEKGPWFFEFEHFTLGSGLIRLRRKIDDKDCSYAFHDIRLLATLMPLNKSGGYNLREGDIFPIEYDEDTAWGIVKVYGRLLNLDWVEHAYWDVEWVDENLQPIGRVDTAFHTAKLRILQDICTETYANGLQQDNDSLYSRVAHAKEVILYRQLISQPNHILVDGDGSCWIEGQDFEYLLDLSKVMECLARSINAHVNNMDYTPNPTKIADYERILDRERLDELALRSDFAKELQMRAEMIKNSAANHYIYGVEKVRAYRPSLFPKTCVWLRK